MSNESYFKITIERLTPYEDRHGYDQEKSKTLYVQRVEAIDIPNICKLVNFTELVHQQTKQAQEDQ